MASRANRPARTATATAKAAALTVMLYAYQKAWIADESRFKIAIKSRQIGWTFGTTLRHVRRRIAKKGLTVWVSASQRQSDEAAEYAKLHLRALRHVFDSSELEFPDTDERAQVITLFPGEPNEARIIFLPANPDTMRGYAGDVVLDEFGFHRDHKKIWKAALAIASRGYQVEVISTPNGQAGKYWEIAKEAGVPATGLEAGRPRQWRKGVWSIHHVDIHEAVRQGCPINPEEMREAAGDEDTWMQEYCCIFLADAENYIPMELVVSCESDLASIELPQDFRPVGSLYAGIDIGRKKDRSVLWLLEKLGDVKWTRRVLTLERTPFSVQFQMFDELLSTPKLLRACIDATGLGAQLAEDLQAKHGSGKIEAVEFNLENKERMATSVKAEFEERLVRIPGSPRIRSSINTVKRYTSTTGKFRFDADRTEAGHADEFWALALANAAADGPGISTDFVAGGVNSYAQAGGYL